MVKPTIIITRFLYIKTVYNDTSLTNDTRKRKHRSKYVISQALILREIFKFCSLFSFFVRDI